MRAGPASTSAALALALVLLLAGCEPPPPSPPSPAPAPTGTQPATPPPEPMTGGTLRFAVNEPVTVPFDATTPDSLIVIDALFDSLTAWAPNLALIPSAATSWETPDGGRTWIFHLREGATFHDEDATPVTAGDFKFAWELAVAQGAAGFHLEPVEGYEALRDGEVTTLAGVTTRAAHTLEVRLREPHGAFPSRVAHPALGPVPRALWQRHAPELRRRPVGNGPFMAAEALVRAQFLRVQRFEGWRNGVEPALLDEVLFQFLDPDTAFVAFQQQRLQVSPLPAGAVELARRRYGRAADGYHGPGVIDGDTPTVYFLAFDVTTPPFDEPAVRRAVSLAIDREAIVSSVLGGNASPATALVAPALSARHDVCEACRHDRAEAARIFAEHGVEAVTLWFNRDGGHRAIAEHVRADLVAAGVRRVVFRAPEFSAFVAALEEGRAALFRYGWQPEYPLPDDVLYPLFHSSRIPPRPEPDPEPEPEAEPGDGEPESEETPGPGDEPEPESEETPGPGDEPEPEDAGSQDGELDVGAAGGAGAPGGRNYMGYHDAEVDALLSDARAATGLLRRGYLHHRAQELVLNRDQVVVPLLFFRHQRVVSDRVVGLTVNPMGLIDLHRVQLRHEPQDGEQAHTSPGASGPAGQRP